MISKLYDKLSNLGWQTRRNNSIDSREYYLIEIQNFIEAWEIGEKDVIWYSWGCGSIEEMKTKEKTVSEYLSVDSTCLIILEKSYVEKRAFGHGMYCERE